MKTLSLLLLLGLSLGAQTQPVVRLPPLTPLITAASATGPQTGSAVKINNLGAYGTLTITGSSITGSPSGCQIVLTAQQSTGTVASSATATQAFTPANSYQAFAITPSQGATADALIATYSCSSLYPSTGTITVGFDPVDVVQIQGTVPVSGTFWQATQPVSIASMPTTAVTGTFWQATQPVSAASLPLPTGAATSANQLTANTSLSSIDGKTPALGQALAAASVPVVLPAAQITTLTPPTTVTVQQSTASNLKVDPSGVTSPISAASLPLPSGAATAAKQPALGTAGTPSADVITVQGATSMTAIKVDGSAVTQPVSGTVTITPSGTQTVSGTVTVQQSTASSLKVDLSGTAANATAIKVDNSAVTQPISAASLPLPSGAATDVAQGSTTSGQTGGLVQGAVTTAAPTYTTAKTNPLSLTTAGALRVDGSASTQPVSISGNQAVNVAQMNGVATSMGNGTTDTGTQRVSLSSDSTGQVKLATGSNTIGALTANQSVNVAQVNGATASTAATGVQKVGVVGNAGAAFDAATGAAPPANAVLLGGLGSGATGGFVTAVPVCDTFAAVNISTATTTLLVTGTSGRHVRVCSLNLVAGAAQNVTLISGTGSTCGTGTAAIIGSTTASSGWNFAANGGIALGNGIGTVLRTVATGDSICAVTSAAAQLSGSLAYTIY